MSEGRLFMLVAVKLLLPVISNADFACDVRGGDCIKPSEEHCSGSLWRGYCSADNRQCCIVDSQPKDAKCVTIAGRCDGSGQTCERGTNTPGLCAQSRNCCVLDDWKYIPRRSYSKGCIQAVNDQIQMELYASHVYLSMAFHFLRKNPAYAKLAAHFMSRSKEETSHAVLLMTYHSERGGHVKLEAVAEPPREKWGSVQTALRIALHLEMKVTASLHSLADLAKSIDDRNLQEFIKSHFFEEQNEDIAALKKQIAEIKATKSKAELYLYIDKTFNAEVH